MKVIRGYYRLSVCGLLLTIGAGAIVLTSFVPVKIGRYLLPMWCLNFLVRSLLWVLRVKYHTIEPDKIRNMHGFLFPNHMTYLDILVLAAITPTRFLAKDGVRSMPLVGQAATAVGCVFVKRGDKESRHQAREAIAKAERFPPITLFPEGKRGQGHQLLPFRYGAFEIAAQTSTPYLPIAIVYDWLDVAIWHRGESILKAVWRLCSRSGPLQATILPLEVIEPTPEDDHIRLSLTAYEQMNRILTEKQYQPSAGESLKQL